MNRPREQPRARTAALGVLLALIGLGPVALSAWRHARLPALIERAAAVSAPVGLRWFDGGSWRAWPPEAPAGGPGPSAVLLVHGLDEPGGVWDHLAPSLHGLGHRVVRFDYRNDQPATVSGDRLVAALERLHDDGVGTLRIVAHSMGGLVARDALTRPDADARPGVPLLIAVGTPHAGSPWAGLQIVSEAREHVQRWLESEDMDPARLFGAWHDGLGGARDDLRPGSAYLAELDARPWPRQTRLVDIVAVIGLDEPADAGLAAISSAARRLGDGLVPADSAASDLADEVLFVNANHRSVIRTIELVEWARDRAGASPAPVPPAIPLILERIGPARP